MSLVLLSRKETSASPAKAAVKPAVAGLRIGSPTDASEVDADRAADAVMSGGATPGWSLSGMSTGSSLRRKCACGGSEGECEECKSKESLQRKAAGAAEAGVAPPIVHSVLNSPGRPLDKAARDFFEPRFGHDFSRIRVHTDDRAAASAKAVNAHAYTVGNNLVFGAGQYDTESTEKQRLLAHELAHTVQQAGSRPGLVQRQEATPQAHPLKEGFEGCDDAMQADLKEKHAPALERVNAAITSLSHGWEQMPPADKAAFQQYFDPAGSGDVDESFVSDVRRNYQTIRSYMSSLTFDCDPKSGSLCGSPEKWCVSGRVMWTCFGNLHVCPEAYRRAEESFKIETMIHESVHNALHTTDREYSSSGEFNRLKPRGSGFLSFLSKIPVIGRLFRLFRSNNDTLYNPDSYSGFAMKV